MKNGNNDPTRYPFNKCHTPLVEIKDFNASIDNKTFFDKPIKNNQEMYEKLVQMSLSDDYTIGNLSEYLYHQKYYKRVGIDLSRQINTSILQQINFVGKLDEDGGTTIFFISGKQQKSILNFSFDPLVVT